MDTNTVLIWTAVLITFVLYVVIIRGILKEGMQQSAAAWILWVALDAIALVSMILQNGNTALLFFYVIGGSIVAGTLIYSKQFKWTGGEWFVLFLVIACLVIWKMSGPRMATISSTLAVVISGLLQVRDSWKKPDRHTGIIYLWFTLVAALSFLGGKAWTIEDRFYYGMCTPLCLAISIAAFRKKLPA